MDIRYFSLQLNVTKFIDASKPCVSAKEKESELREIRKDQTKEQMDRTHTVHKFFSDWK